MAYQNDAQPLGSESKPLGGDGDKNSSSTTRKGPPTTVVNVSKHVERTEGTRYKARKSGQNTQEVVGKLGAYSALIPWLPEKIRNWRGEHASDRLDELGMPRVYRGGYISRSWKNY